MLRPSSLSGLDGSKRQKLTAFNLDEERKTRPLITLHDDQRHPHPATFTEKSDKGQMDSFDAFMVAVSKSTSSIPSSSSPLSITTTTSTPSLTSSSTDSLEEEDPLDAFMKGINQQLTQRSSVSSSVVTAKKPATRYADEEEEDPRYRENTGNRENKEDEEEDDLVALLGRTDDKEYDEEEAADDIELDDDIAHNNRGKQISLLAPLDHSSISYPSFRRHFYSPSVTLISLPAAEIAALTADYDVSTQPPDLCRLCYSFDLMGFDPKLRAAIGKVGYSTPTAIQAQTIPIVLMGRNVIGLAKTGSGKTAAFVLPMLVHLQDQPAISKGEGPIAVIIAPTRELAEQIYIETHRFAKLYKFSVVPVLGGMQKYQQFKQLKAGCSVIVATPGRLLDLIEMKACTLHRCTFLVLDEADRMLSMGFENQIRSIVGQVRPDRQMLMFSATMPEKVQRLARDLVKDPVTITIGTVGAANSNITQYVEVVHNDAQKLNWLLQQLPQFLQHGSILIFVSTRQNCETLEQQLSTHGYNGRVASLHGDKHQFQRMEIIHRFKQVSSSLMILIATDVAARGLDIQDLNTVINWDMARDRDAHIHRIGRTGRAKKQGQAFTLLNPQKDQRKIQWLKETISETGQTAAMQLEEIGKKSTENKSGKSESTSFNNYSNHSITTPVITANPHFLPPSLTFKRAEHVTSQPVQHFTQFPRNQASGLATSIATPIPNAPVATSKTVGSVHPSRMQMMGLTPSSATSSSSFTVPVNVSNVPLIPSAAPSGTPPMPSSVRRSRWDS